MRAPLHFGRLINLPVSRVWFGDHAALFLELGKLTNIERTRSDGAPGNVRGEITIMADCDWRIECKRSILAGNGSSPRKLANLSQILQSTRILSVSTIGVLPELYIEFTEKLRLLTFCRYEGQPDWSILFNSPTEAALGVKAGRIQREKRDA